MHRSSGGGVCHEPGLGPDRCAAGNARPAALKVLPRYRAEWGLKTISAEDFLEEVASGVDLPGGGGVLCSTERLCLGSNAPGDLISLLHGDSRLFVQHFTKLPCFPNDLNSRASL